ncbi:MAG TPA: NAD(P)H-hydrate dehydratase [Gaiellaceae bacterium]|nr:NAD(P)H-hydrate dehydratase [Gaiellaceae bacterium]
MPFEPLYTAAEMRAAEEAYPGTTLELMERAGTAVAGAALRAYPDARRFSVWCGAGANGGDGLVVARKLHEAGRDVAVRLVGSEERVRGDAAENLRRARELGLPFTRGSGEADAVVDALFGTGFSGAPREEAAAAIEELNRLGAPVLAVDLPSGANASTGEVEGPAVRAAQTVTFHGRKLGLAVAPGRFYAGEVVVADIGLEPVETAHRRVTEAVLELVSRRGPEDNKYSAGTVLVVGGSPGLTGAPSLTAEAALRAGAGYVIVCAPEAVNPILEQRLVEPVTRALPSDADGRLTPAAAEAIIAQAERAHAVALGPGLGRGDGVRELVHVLLERLDVPMVLDADALWAVSGALDSVGRRAAPTVLTPHAGELGRLLERESSTVDAHRLASVTEAAAETGATVLLKGADTLVATPTGGTFVCDLGNPGLATAGTGDVLTGVIAAFLAKGMDPPVAAAAAAAACGVAADLAAERHGKAGMIARDVIEALSLALS